MKADRVSRRKYANSASGCNGKIRNRLCISATGKNWAKSATGC